MAKTPRFSLLPPRSSCCYAHGDLGAGGPGHDREGGAVRRRQLSHTGPPTPPPPTWPRFPSARQRNNARPPLATPPTLASCSRPQPHRRRPPLLLAIPTPSSLALRSSPASSSGLGLRHVALPPPRLSVATRDRRPRLLPPPPSPGVRPPAASLAPILCRLQPPIPVLHHRLSFDLCLVNHISPLAGLLQQALADSSSPPLAALLLRGAASPDGQPPTRYYS
ncbi:uncharacterized protein A4U43_C07F38030 [Asparagus officinalis]|uniref:Uncharacterized protein n=1 Tax=Asparagus officinalis TaxID=4686 RepID=A0A5P1EHW0_ASPOF|nr:uncharacterized protein A4U43_C07F38030 [Asparagus officinalis]